MAEGFLPTSLVKAIYRLDCFVKAKISASFLSVLPVPFKFLNTELFSLAEPPWVLLELSVEGCQRQLLSVLVTPT